MAQKKRTTLFVIFAAPQPHSGPGTIYIAKDGTTTEHRSHAANFYTFTDATRFAEENGITLDAVTYIGQDDFTDFELQGR